MMQMQSLEDDWESLSATETGITTQPQDQQQNQASKMEQGA